MYLLSKSFYVIMGDKYFKGDYTMKKILVSILLVGVFSLSTSLDFHTNSIKLSNNTTLLAQDETPDAWGIVFIPNS